MKAFKNHTVRKPFLFFALTFLLPAISFACTIVSAIACNGQVWNMNNEDGPFGVANFINVFPKAGGAGYGYYTLSYFSPELGTGGSMQGGMNEAGLTFDFNAIARVKDIDTKTAFPQGDNAILPHILSTMSTVGEVVDFFDTYWFRSGFRSAQMHVADRQGRFAIISPSGTLLVEKGRPLVSTNFDICGKEDNSSCWRYPIASSKISGSEVNFGLMQAIAVETAQKNGATMYTNIQNLSTGDLWFFSKHDDGKLVQTNIDDLLSKGRKSYTFSDLGSIVEDRPELKWKKRAATDIADSLKIRHTGNYHNSFTGNIEVKPHLKGLEVSFADGRTEVFHTENGDTYFLPEDDVYMEFSYDESAKRHALDIYLDGFWAIRAWITK